METKEWAQSKHTKLLDVIISAVIQDFIKKDFGAQFATTTSTACAESFQWGIYIV